MLFTMLMNDIKEYKYRLKKYLQLNANVWIEVMTKFGMDIKIMKQR